MRVYSRVGRTLRSPLQLRCTSVKSQPGAGLRLGNLNFVSRGELPIQRAMLFEKSGQRKIFERFCARHVCDRPLKLAVGAKIEDALRDEPRLRARGEQGGVTILQKLGDGRRDGRNDWKPRGHADGDGKRRTWRR